MSEYAERGLEEAVREATGSSAGRMGPRIQSLWSGYGAILRFETGHANPHSWIVKHVSPPLAPRYSRGSGSDVGHERKLRSYEVEMHWYREYASRCDDECRVPRPRYLFQKEGKWLFILEDLDAAGFSERRVSLSREELSACLRYLAQFHAIFLGEQGEGLWEVGTYWHLETRPDELLAMKNQRLRQAAPLIDARLRAARFMTLVHGDAKVENFCFAPSLSGPGSGAPRIAAVDFQYVGRGVGVKDVAYFLSSCLSEKECEEQAGKWLDEYFRHLGDALRARRADVDSGAVEAEWRELYPFAWVDFLRFLAGWAPGHYGVQAYSQQMLRQVLNILNS